MDTETPLTNKKKSLSIAVWAITPNGLALGQNLCAGLSDAWLFVSEPLMGHCHPFPGPEPPDPNPACRGYGISTFQRLSDELSQQFTKFSSHIFIFSTGIAVRMIAPLIQSKTKDPGIVVVDDNGIHAISLLSGHLGGANRLAHEIGTLINARPVITTATDVNRLPSIDMLAQENNLYIENPIAIKHVNMAFLNNIAMDVHDPLNFIQTQIPKRFISSPNLPTQGTGVICTWKRIKVPRETLVLRPRILSVGIGCNRNTPVEELHRFLMAVLDSEHLSLNSVFTLATTEVKKDEVGLLSLAVMLDLPLIFYDNNQLNAVDTIETPSKMVEKHLGVKSVCEAAAILGAGKGRLIVPKKKNKDVTIAVALKE